MSLTTYWKRQHGNAMTLQDMRTIFMSGSSLYSPSHHDPEKTQAILDLAQNILCDLSCDTFADLKEEIVQADRLEDYRIPGSNRVIYGEYKVFTPLETIPSRRLFALIIEEIKDEDDITHMPLFTMTAHIQHEGKLDITQMCVAHGYDEIDLPAIVALRRPEGYVRGLCFAAHTLEHMAAYGVIDAQESAGWLDQDFDLVQDKFSYITNRSYDDLHRRLLDQDTSLPDMKR